MLRRASVVVRRGAQCLRELSGARGRSGVSLRAQADVVRALAALVRAGEPPRRALARWHADAPVSLRRPLRRVGRRLALGDRTASAIESARDGLGDATDATVAVVTLAERLGGDLACMLDAVGVATDARARALDAARAAGAGARASAYLVCSLPLAGVAVSPVARASLFDATGVALSAIGVALAVGGMVWVRRLGPSPPELRVATTLCDLVAGAVRGGAGVDEALDHVAVHARGTGVEELRRVRRAVRLGLPWDDALSLCDDEDLALVGATLRRSRFAGAPVADALEGLAVQQRAAAAAAFEAAARRAPVMMTLPLAVCVLPSFVLLTVVPYVRGVTVPG